MNTKKKVVRDALGEQMRKLLKEKLQHDNDIIDALLVKQDTINKQLALLERKIKDRKEAKGTKG